LAWTRQQILDLAPNSLILGKANSLSKAEIWEQTGSLDQYLWGKSNVGGTKTYATLVDQEKPAFYCDCQSREQSCRHVIALLLLHNKYAKLFPEQALPPWAEGLQQQPPKQSSEEEKTQREMAKNARVEKRLELMKGGVYELEKWLIDLTQQGLSILTAQDDTFWSHFASKMVDAKLGGIARRIRGISSLLQEEDWHVHILEVFAQLFLFVQSFKQLDTLPEDMQEDILTMAGMSRKQDVLFSRTGIKDHWLIVGIAESEEENLRSRKTYLIGEHTGRVAYLLDFAWGRQAYDYHWKIGYTIDGEAIFYPGSYPLRIVIKSPRVSKRSFKLSVAYNSLAHFADGFAKAIAANPWISSFPCVLTNMNVHVHDEKLWLVDADHKGILLPDSTASWSLMAVSKGKPLTIFGEWDAIYFYPIAVINKGEVLPLQQRTSNLLENDY
jgi:hypothetical protein